MANRSKSRRPAASRAAASAPERARRAIPAQGRLDHRPPIAVIDIGSNSVRLVDLRGADARPTPIFNEKVLAGLGREVQSTGLLARDAVEKALDGAAPVPRAVRHGRRASGCGASRPPPAATPTTARTSSPRRSASAASSIEVLSGKREAQAVRARRRLGHLPPGRHRRRSRRRLARTGRRARPSGCSRGVTLPLGGLALQDLSEKSIKKAEKIVRKALGGVPLLRAARAAPSTRSAAPGARSRGCTCGRPAIRCT